MDTFAAIALATEPPIKTVTTGAPIKTNAQIMTNAVWRQVIGMSLWSTIVMGIMFASMAMNENYDASVGMDEDNSAAKFKRQRLTEIYNTFMFL
jgi:magnesium-transporting ATPase (P-type)